jgi:hypothetical protein
MTPQKRFGGFIETVEADSAISKTNIGSQFPSGDTITKPFTYETFLTDSY